MCTHFLFLKIKYQTEVSYFNHSQRKILFSGPGHKNLNFPQEEAGWLRPRLGELEKSLKIEGFLLKDKKYQLAMERNIGAFEKKRGIFIINVKGKSIKPYSLIERYTNYENALGYGASPSSNEPILEDNETNPSP